MDVTVVVGNHSNVASIGNVANQRNCPRGGPGSVAKSGTAELAQSFLRSNDPGNISVGGRKLCDMLSA